MNAFGKPYVSMLASIENGPSDVNSIQLYILALLAAYRR
jgi:hypothetical protein